MMQLNRDECRILGVLIEKAQTTPEQYPLSLNAIVNGANQKSNRDPVVSIDDTQASTVLDALRGKGLVIQTDQPGSRVHKYRHNAVEGLHARSGELAILAELLLRGPQTLGELRGRAGRMHPMESIEAVTELLRALSQRGEPLVKEIPPWPGSRAPRYVQLLCPSLHDMQAPPSTPRAVDAGAAAAPGDESLLAQRVATLELQVTELRRALRDLAGKFGEGDLLL